MRELSLKIFCESSYNSCQCKKATAITAASVLTVLTDLSVLTGLTCWLCQWR